MKPFEIDNREAAEAAFSQLPISPDAWVDLDSFSPDARVDLDSFSPVTVKPFEISFARRNPREIRSASFVQRARGSNLSK